MFYFSYVYKVYHLLLYHKSFLHLLMQHNKNQKMHKQDILHFMIILCYLIILKINYFLNQFILSKYVIMDSYVYM